MIRSILLGLMAGVVGVLTACGPNCQKTCDQVYNVCGIDKPGQSKEELILSCVNECNSALQSSGDLDGYQPDSRRSSSESIVLDNETQAAAWMDCVWKHAPDGTPEQCEELDPRSGYCAPI